MWEGADLKTWPVINSSATAVTLGGPRKPLTRSQGLPAMHAGKKAAAVVRSIGQPFPAGVHPSSGWSRHRDAPGFMTTVMVVITVVIPDESRSPWIT